MKALIVLLVLAAGAVLIYRKRAAEKAKVEAVAAAARLGATVARADVARAEDAVKAAEGKVKAAAKAL